ncbi:MAG TPA: hypothetical protein VM779_08970 [Thermoanaerobaculia bacterium]|nr:hypothetical protein [Thermoanaerobaculia bacterium]
MIFDAFTGLAVLLACGVVAGFFLCLRDVDPEDRREWTLRPRRR